MQESVAISGCQLSTGPVTKFSDYVTKLAAKLHLCDNTGLLEGARADLKARNVAGEAGGRACGSLATTAAALAKLGCMPQSIDQGRLAAVGDPCSIQSVRLSYHAAVNLNNTSACKPSFEAEHALCYSARPATYMDDFH